MDSDAFRGQPVLHGETIRLEPFGPEHLDHAWAGLADTEMLRLTGSHATFTREQVDALSWDGQWYDAIVMGILESDPR